MKPFNLAAAEKGAAICTRDGRVAKFIGCYPEAAEINNRVVAGVDGCPQGYTIEGRWSFNEESNLDLFMVPTKCEGYVWICNTVSQRDPIGVRALNPPISTLRRARRANRDLTSQKTPT